ncbi:MAG: NADPH-dependent F420 reductase [Dermatophilaceae bacterium]
MSATPARGTLMKIAVIGSAMVGQVVAAKLVELGHDVVIGTRDPQNLTETKGMGGTLSDWLTANPAGRVATNAEAAAHGEIVVNATNGAASVDALTLAGAENLAGKILIDIANPLDFSKGMPPTLFLSNHDSLGELIQRTFPETTVVKTLNTMNAFLMVDPSLANQGDHTVFLSGDDDAAKATVADLLGSFGWTDIVDLGDITTARGTESLLPLWIRMFGKLGEIPFQFKIVRDTDVQLAPHAPSA